MSDKGATYKAEFAFHLPEFATVFFGETLEELTSKLDAHDPEWRAYTEIYYWNGEFYQKA
jgi:hypothetical protein